IYFFFSSRRRHTRFSRDWSSDVCSSDLRAATSTSGRIRSPAAGRPTTMTTTVLAPVAASERIELLDILRGLALLGIFLMNVEFRSEERRVGKGCSSRRTKDAEQKSSLR